MKIFTIENETNNIMIHASVQEAEAVANAERFRNEVGLAKLAADWPAARLVEIWSSLPGVTPVAKFKDRKTAASRIWKAIQTLGEANQAEAPEPVAEDPEPVAEAEVAAPAPETAPEPEPADTDVAPQTPAVAPAELSARKKVARAKKTPTEPTGAKGPRENSKTSRVIAMLRRDGGTTLEEIMAEMGWLKHTTRAMLSAGGSLTKKHGLVIVSEKVGDQRRYSIKG